MWRLLSPLRSASGRAHISLIVSVIEVGCDECLIVQTSDMVFPNWPSPCDLVKPQERESGLSIPLQEHQEYLTEKQPR